MQVIIVQDLLLLLFLFYISNMKLFLSCCLLLFLVKSGKLEQRLNVNILYESLCPDSLKFVREQLYPAWKDIAPYVNLKFVPFGKSASLEDKQSFICQHGPKECMGNRIQSCALSALEDSSTQVEFVNCFMASFKKAPADEEHGQTCAANIGLNWEYVTQCYESDRGTSLQLIAEHETATITPKFVPTILYNGQFNQEAQDESLTNFRGVVCSFIKQNYPQAC